MNSKKNSNDDCELRDLTRPWKMTVISISYDLSCIELFIDYDYEKIVCPACSMSVNIVSKVMYTLHISKIIFGFRAKLTAHVPIIGQNNKNCNREPLAISNTFLLYIIIKLMVKPHGNNPLLYLFNAIAGRCEKPSSELTTISADFKSF
jgi:hypothetical protein